MLHFRSLILLSAFILLGTNLSAMDSEEDDITDFSPSSSPIEKITEYPPSSFSSVEEITEYDEEPIPTHLKRKGKRPLQSRGLKDSSSLLEKLSRPQPRSSHPSPQADESSPEISVKENKENMPPLRNRVILPLGGSQPVKEKGTKKRRIDY